MPLFPSLGMAVWKRHRRTPQHSGHLHQLGKQAKHRREKHPESKATGSSPEKEPAGRDQGQRQKEVLPLSPLSFPTLKLVDGIPLAEEAGS